MGKFIHELRRRNIFRVAGMYAVIAWLLAQIAATLEEAIGLPLWFDGVVVTLLMLGFPIAVIFAWAFELTPDGVKLTRNLAEEESHDSQSGKRLDYAILVGLLLFAVFGVRDLLAPAQINETVPPFESATELTQSLISKSIAVLPFDNRSNRDEDAFFTDGIHDDLLTQISRIHDIKTISRTSVMAYRNTTKNIRAIGKELGVATILEGGVQRAGDQIRINVQLIDVATDAHLWAETYTRDLTAKNVFRIQSEISIAIATTLRSILSPEEQQRLNRLPTENMAALEAYFHARTDAISSDSASIHDAIVHAQHAIDLDPEFADAYALLASIYISQIWFNGLPSLEQVDKAEPMIDKALQLDSQLSSAYVVMGNVASIRNDYVAAEQAFRKAIELNPNQFEAYTDYGNMLLWEVSDLPAAIVQLGKAWALNPTEASIQQQLGDALAHDGQFDEARRILDAVLAEYPDYAQGWTSSGNLIDESTSRFDEMIQEYHRAYLLDELNPWNSMRLGWAWLRIGDPDRSIEWYAHVLEIAPENNAATWFEGINRMTRGEPEAALDIFRQSTPLSLSHAFTLYIATGLELEKGQADNAIESILDANPELAEPVPEIGQVGGFIALALGHAWKSVGEQERCDRLLTHFLEAIEDGKHFSFFDETYLTTGIHLGLGDRDKALESLRKGIDSGFANAFMSRDAVFSSLRGDPEFEELMVRMDARLEEQRATLYGSEVAGGFSTTPPKKTLQ